MSCHGGRFDVSGRVITGPSTRDMETMIGVAESEMDVLHKYYAKLSQKAEAENDIHKSHSIDKSNLQSDANQVINGNNSAQA